MHLEFEKSTPPYNSFGVKLKLPKLTVIVGENGSGKTRFLKAIKDGIIVNDVVYRLPDSPHTSRIPLESDILLRDFNDLFKIDTDSSTGRNINPEPSRQKDPFSKPLFQKQLAYLHAKESNLFARFRNKENGDSRKVLSDEEFSKVHGVDPVPSANDLLRKANLPFRFEMELNNSEDDRPWDSPHFQSTGIAMVKLERDNATSEKFSAKGLSSGEKVLVALALLQHDERVLASQTPKLVLLDEIDSVLHPSAVRKMMDVIDNVLIGEMGCHVILTTHSPTTVALADEDSLHMLKTGDPGLHKVTKREIVNMLTRDVPLEIDYSQTRFVICEHEYDAEAFSHLAANREIWPTQTKKLVFIGAGSTPLAATGGKDRVKALVEKFSSNQNQSVFGLIDYDNENEPTDRLVVFGHKERYTIENTIFDPLLLLALVRSITKKDLPVIGAPENLSVEKLLNENNADVQTYINKIQEIVLGPIGSNTTVPVQYCSGRVLELRLDWLRHNGHKLSQEIAKKLIAEVKGLKKFEDANNTDETIRKLKKEILGKVMIDSPSLAPIAFRKAFDDLSK
jgi:ABC-type cobalamin/Fe3+-siderophores transport system ATPase subunit